MVAWTLWLDTATHHDGQFPLAIQPGHRAGAVVAYPQRLTALLTRLFQRGQSDCVRRFETPSSSTHPFTPAVLFRPFSACRLHPLSSFVFRSAKKCDRTRAPIGERLGLAVWNEDEAGPYQTIPYPGSSWQPEGKAVQQPTVLTQYLCALR